MAGGALMRATASPYSANLRIYASATSPVEFIKTMQCLTAAQKYVLLTKHQVLSKTFVFPSQFLGCCYAWLEENPWLVYSEHVDGMFCIFCSIFCKDTSKGYFASKPVEYEE